MQIIEMPLAWSHSFFLYFATSIVYQLSSSAINTHQSVNHNNMYWEWWKNSCMHMFDICNHPFGLHGKWEMWLKSDLRAVLCYRVMLALSDAKDFFQRPPPSCVCADIVWQRVHWRSQEELNNKKKKIYVIKDYYQLYS